MQKHRAEAHRNTQAPLEMLRMINVALKPLGKGEHYFLSLSTGRSFGKDASKCILHIIRKKTPYGSRDIKCKVRFTYADIQVKYSAVQVL